MHNYKELTVWQKSVDFTVKLYKVTSRIPAEEKFGLISQMRRSAISISSNIAEGAGRKTLKDFFNFLGNALGSSFECSTQITISYKLQYISQKEFNELSESMDHIQKMIHGLQKSLLQTK
jgi:four helix bundle protein